MHPLLKTTRRTCVRLDHAYPRNATYDFHRGLWLASAGPLCHDRGNMAFSKKEDVETGEDQKGQ